MSANRFVSNSVRTDVVCKPCKCALIKGMENTDIVGATIVVFVIGIGFGYYLTKFFFGL